MPKKGTNRKTAVTHTDDSTTDLREGLFQKNGSITLGSSHTFRWLQEVATKYYIMESKKKKGGKKKPVYARSFEGHFVDQKAGKKIAKKIKEISTEMLMKQAYGESEIQELHLLEDGLLFTEHMSPDDYMTIRTCTSNDKFNKDLEKFLKPLLTRKPKDNLGRVFVLANEGHGLIMRSLGIAAVDLEIGNYAEGAQSGIKAIVDDLKSSVPGGRLTILEGPPGGGKTFLIRSLIKEVPRAFFVVVPPSLVQNLGDPGMVPALLGLKSDEAEDEEHESDPVVLIVEDADEALTKRGMDNQTSISSLLNLTSGILGDLLDVRIIATTNAKKTDIESALLRDGRLSFHLNIGKLTKHQAQEIFRRLVKNKKAKYTGELLLASIYKEAREKGFGNSPTTKAKSGEGKRIRQNKKDPFGSPRRNRRILRDIEESVDDEWLEGEYEEDNTTIGFH